MMNERLNDLYQKYIDETFTEEEREEFLLLLTEVPQEQQASKLMDNTWNKMEVTAAMDKHTSDHILNRILTDHARPVVRRISWVRYAAAILILLSAGVYLFHITRTPEPQSTNITASIHPGTNTAVLTLSNGAVINLDNAGTGEIAHQAGILITKTADGKVVYTAPPRTGMIPGAGTAHDFNTISTPAGGQYQINLPDGSKVWLNAASSLKYPAVFSSTERKVELLGEAYFEIAKMTIKSPETNHKKVRMPFIVVTSKQDVEVLGTHFNINSYEDEGMTKTTLLEGSVKVTTALTTQNVVLKPGQQSTVAGKAIKVGEVDTEEAVAWKNGYFQFNESDLGSIMRQLSRWYNIEVVFQDNKKSEELFHLKASRNLGLNDMIKIFNLNGIKLKMERRTLIVEP